MRHLGTAPPQDPGGFRVCGAGEGGGPRLSPWHERRGQKDGRSLPDPLSTHLPPRLPAQSPAPATVGASPSSSCVHRGGAGPGQMIGCDEKGNSPHSCCRPTAVSEGTPPRGLLQPKVKVERNGLSDLVQGTACGRAGRGAGSGIGGHSAGVHRCLFGKRLCSPMKQDVVFSRLKH